MDQLDLSRETKYSLLKDRIVALEIPAHFPENFLDGHPDDVDIDEKPTLTDNVVVDDSCTTPDGLEGQCVSLSDCPPLLQVSNPF